MSSDREEDHRSVLATIGQLRASAWHEFNVWALANGRQSLPAEPQTVALYLGRLAADGRAMATIAQARAAISHAHAAEGMAKGDNPARLRSWPKRSRAGRIRCQRPSRPAHPRPWHASGRPPNL